MLLAVICDIHGNLAALEATLEHLGRESVDQVIVAGDVVNGAPDSRACWQMIRRLGYPALRGNHERYLYDLGTPAEDPEWQGEPFAPVHWAAKQFDRAELEEMRKLPLCLRIEDYPDLLITHASPRRDNDNVRPYTPDDDLEEMFAGVRERLIVRGHNHVPNSRRWGRRSIVNCGSVGMSLDGNPSAQFLLLEFGKQGWRWEHRTVRYDVSATVRRFREGGYLEAAGPMGRLLLREVATGSHHMVPFLREWDRWSLHGTLKLHEAVERFLNEW